MRLQQGNASRSWRAGSRLPFAASIRSSNDILDPAAIDAVTRAPRDRKVVILALLMPGCCRRIRMGARQGGTPMDVTQGNAILHSGAEALQNAGEQARHRASRMADTARYGIRVAGNEVGSFVHRRPIETALLSAAAACLITGLAFWFSRPD
jgi:hypothetical protein